MSTENLHKLQVGILTNNRYRENNQKIKLNKVYFCNKCTISVRTNELHLALLFISPIQ